MVLREYTIGRFALTFAPDDPEQMRVSYTRGQHDDGLHEDPAEDEAPEPKFEDLLDATPDVVMDFGIYRLKWDSLGDPQAFHNSNAPRVDIGKF